MDPAQCSFLMLTLSSVWMTHGDIWQGMGYCVRLPLGYVWHLALLILWDAMAGKSFSSCWQGWACLQRFARQKSCAQPLLHTPVPGSLIFPPLLSLSRP